MYRGAEQRYGIPALFGASRTRRLAAGGMYWPAHDVVQRRHRNALRRRYRSYTAHDGHTMEILSNDFQPPLGKRSRQWSIDMVIVGRAPA